MLCAVASGLFFLNPRALGPKLRSVQFWNCSDLTSAAAFGLAAHCPQLKSVIFYACQNMVRDSEDSKAALKAGCPKLVTCQVGVNTMQDLSEQMLSHKPTDKIAAACKCRMLLSTERNPPIQDAINCGFVPYLLEFMQEDTYTKLIFEAAWVSQVDCTTVQLRRAFRCLLIPLLLWCPVALPVA